MANPYKDRLYVGSIVLALATTGVCDKGELGVCYEVYPRNNDPVDPDLGYSFIFEKGRYDGFSAKDIELMLLVTDMVDPWIASYEFKNVLQLARDYQAGRFATAWQYRPRAVH